MSGSLPPHVRWVSSRRHLPGERVAHLASRTVDLSLCGRVRPGADLSLPLPLPPCRRCASRALVLGWVPLDTLAGSG